MIVGGFYSEVSLQKREAEGTVHTKCFFDCWWCVVLLKRHSSIVRLPGRTCKHVRAPISHPTISEGELGSSVITHASTWGDTY